MLLSLNLFAIRNTFKVYERLKREQHINTLFLTGKAFSVFPLRIVYNILPAAAEPARYPVQVGFSVPKKRFRSSVHRHRVRRLMAEAWRLNRHPLLAAIPTGRQLHVFLIFTGKDMPDYAQVLPAVIKAIEKLIELPFPDA